MLVLMPHALQLYNKGGLAFAVRWSSSASEMLLQYDERCGVNRARMRAHVERLLLHFDVCLL